MRRITHRPFNRLGTLAAGLVITASVASLAVSQIFVHRPYNGPVFINDYGCLDPSVPEERLAIQELRQICDQDAAAKGCSTGILRTGAADPLTNTTYICEITYPRDPRRPLRWICEGVGGDECGGYCTTPFCYSTQ